MKLSILIPVYNEKETVEKVVKEVEKLSAQKEIIIIDDGSTDGTRAVLANKIRSNIESVLGISCKVHLVEPKSIARSEGKAKRVIDNRK